MNDASPPPGLEPLPFAALPGWADDDHAAAFRAFRRGSAVLAEHPPKTRALGMDGALLAEALRRAENLPADLSAGHARQFFEVHFTPRRIVPPAGFFTGYYEPVVAGSRKRSARFPVPLLRPPADLVEIEPGSVPGLSPDFRFARRTGDGFAEHPDRGAVMAGALDGRDLELVWLADWIEAFFIHVQGAARIRLAEGGEMRVTYAAKSGHAYSPVGKVLLERGVAPPVTMQVIRAWLAAHPDDLASVLATNRSYIFFREAAVDDPALGPIAAAKVPLSEGRSLAVDRLLHTFHTPVFVDTTTPDGAPYRRLMIAQDTGSAIVGPGRGDIFFGSGDAAGEIAGRMKASGGFFILAPKP
ncbi:MAG: MltA domain-containing protein [Rhizobiales bacterium]|nr:MltA domain-containing protein [Hyphomicrobiales bacterium]